jgi:hypothetical protein
MSRQIKDKLVLVQAIKAYSWRRAPLIPDLDAIWKLMDSVTHRTLYPWGKIGS